MKLNAVQKPTTKSSELAPEWLTVDQACEFVHMGKTCLYSHLDINGGRIRTANVRKRGLLRGKRLVSVDSLRDFVESCAERGQAS